MIPTTYPNKDVLMYGTVNGTYDGRLSMLDTIVWREMHAQSNWTYLVVGLEVAADPYLTGAVSYGTLLVGVSVGTTLANSAAIQIGPTWTDSGNSPARVATSTNSARVVVYSPAALAHAGTVVSASHLVNSFISVESGTQYGQILAFFNRSQGTTVGVSVVAPDRASDVNTQTGLNNYDVLVTTMGSATSFASTGTSLSLSTSSAVNAATKYAVANTNYDHLFVGWLGGVTRMEVTDIYGRTNPYS
jgi:hypothetical protein